MKFFLVFYLIVFLQLLGIAQSNHFEEGNTAYQNEKYEAAITAYQSLLEETSSPAIHYNLANAYYKKGNLGKAILHYEKALRLSPNDKDIKANLELANDSIESDIMPIQEFFLKVWWRTAAQNLSSTSWAVLGLILLWLGAALFFFYKKNKKNLVLLFACLCGILSILPFAFAFTSQDNSKSNYAILLEDTSLHSAPDEKNTEIYSLSEGVKIRTLDKIEDWYEVKLANGDTGWINQQFLEKI